MTERTTICPVCGEDIEVLIEWTDDGAADIYGPSSFFVGEIQAPADRPEESCKCLLTPKQESAVIEQVIKDEYYA